METNFNSLTELKERITPALTTKVKELKIDHYHNITEEDIWNYLKKDWQKKTNLTLYDIVNDILKLDNEKIFDYKIKRSINHDEK